MTIWMVYTAWALLVATGLLWRLIAGPRCTHSWSVVTDREFQAAAKDVQELGFKFPEGATANWWRRLYWAVLSCGRCGALKTFTVNHTPEDKR